MHSITSYAEQAYAAGWASTDGPITDQVRAGMTAAVAHAIDNHDHPHVFEQVIHLGRLEGVWAQIYARRDQIEATNHETLIPLWRAMIGRLDISTAIYQFRRLAGMSEVAESSKEWLTEATAIAVQLLRKLSTDDDWPAFRAGLRELLATGTAEGTAAALLLGAQQLDRIGFDFDLAFDDAYAALGELGTLFGPADRWALDILDSQARELGRILSRLAADGAPYEDMYSAAVDLLGGEDLRGVQMLLDLASSRAMSQGALDLYAREGVTEVDFVTAMDQRVCPICTAAEAAGPYHIGAAPVPGLHPNCRCTLAPVDFLSSSAVAPYLSGKE